MHNESKKRRRNYLFPGNYNSLVALLWGLLFCLEFLYSFSNFSCYMHYLVAFFYTRLCKSFRTIILLMVKMRLLLQRPTITLLLLYDNWAADPIPFQA